MEAPEFGSIQREEQRDRERSDAVLEGLSGFSRLSEAQQKYIRASLYIQQRAERGTDEVSAARIRPIPNEFAQFAPGRATIAQPGILLSEEGPNAQRYFESQRYIMSEYCHRVISALERHGVGGRRTPEWSDAGPVHSYAELEDLIGLFTHSHTPPFVLQVQKLVGELKGPEHSTVLLGQNTEGDFIVWEKAGYHLPFQLMTLRDVYTAYEKYTGWRVRQLQL